MEFSYASSERHTSKQFFSVEIVFMDKENAQVQNGWQPD
jgi:hypothetical protein